MSEPTLYQDVWTAYHDDGTDYLNDELEQKVLDAVSRYAFLPENSLLPIAAVRAVVDWIEERGPVEPDYEAAAKCLWYQERYTDFRNHPSEQDEYRRRARLIVDAGAGIGGDDD